MVSPSDGAKSQLMPFQAVKLAYAMRFGIVESLKLNGLKPMGLAFL